MPTTHPANAPPPQAPSQLLGAGITTHPANEPVLVVHLGGPKTGSSAIQAFCDRNRTELFRRHSILYPTLDPDRIPDGAAPFIPGDPACELAHHGAVVMGMQPAAQDDYLARALDTCRRTGTRVLLLSLEAPALPAYADMVRRNADRFDGRTFAVCYVRRQDEWVESAWKQWGLKYDRCATADDFARDLMTHAVRDDFFDAAVSVLEHTWLDHAWSFLPARCMVVRPYERSALRDGDVVADLLGLLGASTLHGLIQPSATNFNTNHDLAPEAIRLLRMVRPMFSGVFDNAPFELLHDALPDAVGKPFATAGLLSPRMRAEILSHYAPHNQRLARRMPGHEDGVLFRESPDPDAPWWPDRELSPAEVATMLMRCIQRQHARIEDLQTRLARLEQAERTRKVAAPPQE